MSTLHPIHHATTGQTDKRYTVNKEYAGQAAPVWVARFCGEFIRTSLSYSAMVLRCVGHKAEMNGALVITEQRKA